MFGLSNLVGTPRTAGSKLEFTPIGRRRNNGVPETTPTGLGKINNSMMDSSFDNTSGYDTLQPINTNDKGQSKENAMFENMFRPPQLVDGTSSIQELLDEIKRLQGENYSLRVEVATLTKYMKQAPQDQRDAVYENVQLKQKLDRTSQELENARNHARDSDSSHALHSLRKEIESREDEIHRLQEKISGLERRANVSHDAAGRLDGTMAKLDEALGKIEFLQSENQSLRRKLDDATNDRLDVHAIQAENNTLKARVNELERTVKQYPADAPQQVQHLQEDNSILERKLHAVQRDLDQSERERRALDTAVAQVREQLAVQTAETERLRRDKDSMASRSKSLSDTRLEEARAELQEEKQRLRRQIAEFREEVRDKEAEIRRLSQKVDSLQQELSKKEDDVDSLDRQVRSLMAERHAASDTQSTLRHYQTQIEALRDKEVAMQRENHDLKSENAKLNNELYQASADSDRAAALRTEILEMEDRLDYYEKEYERLQDEMEAKEAEYNTKEAQYNAREETYRAKEEEHRAKERHAESTVTRLLSEIDLLNALLRQQSYKSQSYDDLNKRDVDRARADADRIRLEQQIEALQLQVRKLESELRDKPSSSTDYFEERSRLERDLHDKELRLKEQKYKYARLEDMLNDKQELVAELEARIRELQRQYRTSALDDKSELYRVNAEVSQAEMHKLRVDYESQLRSLQLENDRLQRDLEDRIRYYKTKIDVLQEREPAGGSAMVALLEVQLEDVRRQNSELQVQLDNVRNLNRDLNDKLTAAQKFTQSDAESILADYRTRLADLQAKYSQTQDEKIQLQLTVDTLEVDAKTLRSEKARLEQRAATLSQDLARTTRHCTKLAAKVNDMGLDTRNTARMNDEAMRVKRANTQLQNQVDLLTAKLADAKLVTPRNPRTSTEVRLLKNELQFYKSRLYELNLRANDLALMNAYITSSMRNANRMIKNDIVKIGTCGIYPDYVNLTKVSEGPPSFRVLAKFVLAMVRLKRRMERAEDRRGKMQQLRGEIDRDKLTLLVE